MYINTSVLLQITIQDLWYLDCSNRKSVFVVIFFTALSKKEAHRIFFMECKKHCDFSVPFGFLSFVIFFCFLCVLLFFSSIFCSYHTTLPLPIFCPLFSPLFSCLCYPCSIKAIQSRHPVRASCVICQGDSNALFLFIFEQCLHYQCIRCMARQY